MQDLGYNIGVLKVEVKEIRKRFRVGRLWRQLIAQPMRSIGAQGSKLKAPRLNPLHSISSIYLTGQAKLKGISIRQSADNGCRRLDLIFG